MKKVGVSKEEKNLSYFKYFEQEMAKIPQDKLDIWNGDAVSEEKCLSFDNKDLYLEGIDDEFCQTGFGVAKDGTGFVANTTYMPGVTGEMLDWWFAWHSVGSDLRYKMWDNEDHYFARADKVDYVCDPNVPMNQKTWGVNHVILEDIGLEPELLKLCFKSPKDFGYTPEIVGKEKCESMVCAIGESTVAAAMTHKWYPYKDGVLFCSRFWIGFGLVEGKIIKTLPEHVKLPIIVPKTLFGHNIKEYQNLAAILPKVYAEEKDNF